MGSLQNLKMDFRWRSKYLDDIRALSVFDGTDEDDGASNTGDTPEQGKLPIGRDNVETSRRIS